jgi:hypothetical protein
MASALGMHVNLFSDTGTNSFLGDLLYNCSPSPSHQCAITVVHRDFVNFNQQRHTKMVPKGHEITIFSGCWSLVGLPICDVDPCIHHNQGKLATFVSFFILICTNIKSCLVSPLFSALSTPMYYSPSDRVTSYQSRRPDAHFFPPQYNIHLHKFSQLNRSFIYRLLADSYPFPCYLLH